MKENSTRRANMAGKVHTTSDYSRIVFGNRRQRVVTVGKCKQRMFTAMKCKQQ